MPVTYVMIGVLVGIAVVGIAIFLLLWQRKKETKPKDVDYYTFYAVGLIFLPLGAAFSITVSPAFMGLAGLGVVYIAIGLQNKDKWKTRQKKR
jgi:hypothetical protein